MGKNEDRRDVVINTRRRRHIARLALLVALGAVLLGASTAASYYVDALWFESLGLCVGILDAAQPAGRDFRSLRARYLSRGLWRVSGC